MAAGNILIVDDEQKAVRSLIMDLEEGDFTVYQTGDKGAVLDLYQKGSIDVSLVALNVSGFSGFEVLSMLKSFDPEANIILYTDFGSKENIVRALRLGAEEFLEKPLAVDTLLPILERLMEGGKKDLGLRGNLRTMSLASIIQINCEERNRAQLYIRNKGQEGRIYFDQGRVMHAEVNDLMGEEAIYRLLGWDEGSFRLEMGMAAPLRTVDAGWSELILEGVRRIDERQASGEEAGGSGIFREEETAKKQSGAAQRTTKAISRLDDVEGVVICDQDGNVQASNFRGDDRQVAAISLYLTRQAVELGKSISGGPFKGAFMSSEERKELIIAKGEEIVYLVAAKRTVMESLAESARMMIMRYHTG